MRYQGERAAEVEVELRWQAHPRFSVVGFAGAGVARTDAALADRDKTVTSGGGGFRYLLARTTACTWHRHRVRPRQADHLRRLRQRLDSPMTGGLRLRCNSGSARRRDGDDRP
jgi:hypothetical protein